MVACVALFLLHLPSNLGSKNAIMVARVLELCFCAVETHACNANNVVGFGISIDFQRGIIEVFHLFCHFAELALPDTFIFLRFEGAILTYVRP